MAQQGGAGGGGAGGGAAPVAAAIDPNIQAILGQHQQQLQFIQQQQQQQQQLAQQQADTNRVQSWLREQSQKIPSCDGTSHDHVRYWLRNIGKAVDRVPAGQNVDSYLYKLMCATATDDLLDEVELQRQPLQPPPPHLQVRAHVTLSFLGPDEGNVLKEDLKRAKQGQRETVPTFNRRYSKLADFAHPLPRAADIEEEVTDGYLGSLLKGRVKDRCFAHDPQLVALQVAMQVAADEWTRQRRRARVQRDSDHRGDEPMEVDAAGRQDEDDAACSLNDAPPTVRDTMAALASTLRSLQLEVKNMKDSKPPAPRAHQPQSSSREPAPPRRDGGGDRFLGKCYYCERRGHRASDCRKRLQNQQGEQGNPHQRQGDPHQQQGNPRHQQGN